MSYRYSNISSSISFGGPLTPRIKFIIVTCIIIFVMQALGGGLGGPVTRLLSLTPAHILEQHFVWQLFTYIFLHADVFHLMINMLILFMFGCEIERRWGSKLFWRYFVITGIGAGICVFLVNLFSPLGYYYPTLGASGAIYGVLVAYGLTFPNRIIYVMLLFPLPARYAVMIFGGISFLSSISGSSSGISHTAHLGGMLVGYLYLKGGYSKKRYTINSWAKFIKKLYLEYKFQQAKKKFTIHLKDDSKDTDDNRTIH